MPPMEVPQLHFLNQAAEWLATRSPSTSAHLLGVHTRILHEDLKPLNTHQKKHHCACGGLRQSPKTTRITKVKSKGKKKGNSLGSATVYKCLRCRQRTVLSRQKPLPTRPTAKSSRALNPIIAKPPIPHISTPAETSALESSNPSISSNPTDPPKTVENVNSKKRAKSRKQGGLQALLAAKQKSQASLDLFDFLH